MKLFTFFYGLFSGALLHSYIKGVVAGTPDHVTLAIGALMLVLFISDLQQLKTK
jgi:hypothetical protein